MEDIKVIEYRFENIDKCIVKIADKQEEHEKRISESEKARGILFEKIDTLTNNINNLTKVLWFLGAGIFGAIITAIMQVILI